MEVTWSNVSAQKDTGCAVLILSIQSFLKSEAHEFVAGRSARCRVCSSRVSSSKDMLVTSTIVFPIVLFALLMRSISLLLIWVVQVLSSLVRTMQTLCTTLFLSILNVLEEVRKLNETFDGEDKEWTEANRPKLWINLPRSSTLDLLACIQSTIN